MPLSSIKINNAPLDVTADKILDAAYQNVKIDKILYVNFYGYFVDSAVIQAFSGVSVPSDIASGVVGIHSTGLSENEYFGLTFIVQPLYWYEIRSTIIGGTITINRWFETFI